MTVGTFVQPDHAVQTEGTAYKLAIKNAVMVLARIGAMFAPHEQDTPDMTVRLDAGALLAYSALTEVAAQDTGTITAPTGSDHRVDRVVLDLLTGAVSVVTGTPGSLPRTAPAIPSGKLPICQVALAYDTTAITNNLITDERVAGGASPEAIKVNGVYVNLGADPATELNYGTWTKLSGPAGGIFSPTLPPAYNDSYVKATSYNGVQYPHLTLDPANSLTGANTSSWASGSGSITNQRFHVDLGVAILLRRVRYDNTHHNGVATGQGPKAFTLWGSNSPAAFAELTYALDTNWTQLSTDISHLEQHVGSNIADPHYVSVNSSVAYRYYAFKFANNWGDENWMSLRRLEFETGTHQWLRTA